MASESIDSENSSSIFDQLRSSFLSSILMGLMGPSSDSAPDRVVLVNPVTQGMIMLRGDAATISDILGGGAGGGGAPPASKASIEALKSVDSAELEDECSVCLDDLKREEAVKEMPCRHQFHGGCIEKWLKLHGSCPVCRFEMPIEEGEGLNKERQGDRHVWVTIALRRSAGRDEQHQEEQQTSN